MEQVSVTGAGLLGTTRHNVLTWDGTILEVFGACPTQGLSQGVAHRFHRDLLDVTVEGPDRKGRHFVSFLMGGSGVRLEVDDAAWPQVSAFVERVRAAVA